MTETISHGWIAMGAILVFLGSAVQAVHLRRTMQTSAAWSLLAIGAALIAVGAGHLAGWWG
ncbi:hypothetical protein AB3X52_06455 [Nocardioides sp. DS6]|uniref:Uncharacterized protein n=1 Tax=Nocardioides eburneus TaxID=3231482 RepID=A0ABV3SWE9_9ACTN